MTWLHGRCIPIRILRGLCIIRLNDGFGIGRDSNVQLVPVRHMQVSLLAVDELPALIALIGDVEALHS